MAANVINIKLKTSTQQQPNVLINEGMNTDGNQYLLLVLLFNVNTQRENTTIAG